MNGLLVYIILQELNLLVDSELNVYSFGKQTKQVIQNSCCRNSKTYS